MVVDTRLTHDRYTGIYAYTGVNRCTGIYAYTRVYTGASPVTGRAHPPHPTQTAGTRTHSEKSVPWEIHGIKACKDEFSECVPAGTAAASSSRQNPRSLGLPPRSWASSRLCVCVCVCIGLLLAYVCVFVCV